MPDQKPSQDVGIQIEDAKGQVQLSFLTAGVNPLTFNLDPQAAFEMGEKMARAAHRARFGKEPPSDHSYLHEQIRSRVTEDLRDFLAQRVSVMLNSLREDKTWSNPKLAGELVDVVLTKVA